MVRPIGYTYFTGALYALNIIDANVDAHMYTFREQEFTLDLKPQMHSAGGGISLVLSF